MIKMAVPFSEILEKKLPRKWVRNIAVYSANAQAIKSVSIWQIALRAYIIQIVINTIIIAAIILLSAKYLLPLVEDSKFGNAIAALITVVVIAPFLWALSLRRVAVNEVNTLFKERKYRGPILMLIFIRMALAIFYIGFLLNIFFSPIVALFALAIAIFIYFLAPKKLNEQYHRIENHFLKNFNGPDEKKIFRRYSNLTPWDGHMINFEIAKESNIAGKTLKELRIREDLGINIAFIKRGEITIKIPTQNERLFPGDEIGVIGSEDQLQKFKTYLDLHEFEIPPVKVIPEIVLKQIELYDEEYIGKSIKESKLREKTQGLIVGIEKNGRRMLNPESNIILEKKDVLWIVGDKKLIAGLTRD